MNDLFASYAEASIPPYVRRAQERKEAAATKAPSALEKKLAERQRLAKSYRLWRAETNKAILEQEPRLRAFAKYVRHATDCDELVEAITESWLPGSSDDVRFMALRIVSARCDKLNRMAGFQALDDPLPPETSCYFRARAALGVR